MNKVEMAGRLAARTGLSKAIVREGVDGVFAAIGDALANGEEVRIAGFGTFGTRSRAARTGRKSEGRRGRFGIGVDIADVQGREDAEGCREGGSQVMTAATPADCDSERLRPPECAIQPIAVR